MDSYKINALKIVFWNSQGLAGKIRELREFSDRHKPDIICVQETKLHKNNSAYIPNYFVYRNDRIMAPNVPFTKHGTAIFIKSSIPHSRIDTPNLNFVEATIVNIHPLSQPNLTIASIYVKNNPYRFLTDELEIIHDLAGPNHLLCGDFNARHIFWDPNNGITNYAGTLVYRFAQQFDYMICSSSTPTHFWHNSQTIIDFALLKGTQYGSNLTIDSVPDLNSDHNPVILEIFDDITFKRTGNYLKANWHDFQQYLSEVSNPFDNINTPEEFDQAVSRFTGILTEAHRNSSIVFHNSQDIYTPPEIRELIRQKNRALREWQRFRDPRDKTLYNRLRALIKRKIKKLTQDDWANYLNSLNPEDNSLFTATQRRKRTKQEIPKLNYNGSLALNEKDKAECLADAYEEQFKDNPTINNNFFDNVTQSVSESLSKPIETLPVEVQTHEITDYIKKIKIKKAPGFDGITNKLVKNLPNNIILYLVDAFNNMLRLSYFPKDWKIAVVMPILKPDKDPTDPVSYRPISLLPIIAKMAEIIIRNRLQTFLELNDTIIPEQFGFRYTLSTTQQLLRVTEYIHEGFQNNQTTVAIFLDISKAFDRVWITGLIFKLFRIGVPDYIVKLISSYLNDRFFVVRQANALSSQRPILAGTVQGSVLGPTLFNIYINDIPKYFKTEIALFADDTVVYSKSHNPKYATLAVQHHINILQTWLNDWKIGINVDKNAAMMFNKNKKNHTIHKYKYLKMFNHSLPWQQSTKYLGVILDRQLNWKLHFDSIKTKTRKILFKLNYLISYNSPLNISNKLLIYKTIIRPIITYACPVWASACKTRINELNRIQNIIIRHRVTQARWFMRNKDLRRDLDLLQLSDFIAKISENFFTRTDNNDNPLLQNLPRYDFRDPNFIRRPRASIFPAT